MTLGAVLGFGVEEIEIEHAADVRNAIAAEQGAGGAVLHFQAAQGMPAIAGHEAAKAGGQARKEAPPGGGAEPRVDAGLGGEGRRGFEQAEEFDFLTLVVEAGGDFRGEISAEAEAGEAVRAVRLDGADFRDVGVGHFGDAAEAAGAFGDALGVGDAA